MLNRPVNKHYCEKKCVLFYSVCTFTHIGVAVSVSTCSYIQYNSISVNYWFCVGLCGVEVKPYSTHAQTVISPVNVFCSVEVTKQLTSLKNLRCAKGCFPQMY